MPTSNVEMIRKLQIALNSRGYRVLCSRSQFYSEQQQRPITIYKLEQSVWNASLGKNNHKELFSTASQIQMVLFMRNLWYAANNMTIPPTNNMKGADEFTRAWANFVENGLDSFLELSNKNT